ncbi:MAG: methylmalonyl-CoA mutase subunit beta [Bacteroidota bacterium]
MTNSNLFEEFSAVTSKQWKQKIQYDLKGADYNDALVWESLEGIRVKPFYHAGDVTKNISFRLPQDHHWQIGQALYAQNAGLTNQKALDAIHKGATSLMIEIPESDIDWGILFRDVPLEKIPVHLHFKFLEANAIKRLLDQIGSGTAQLFLNIDSIGHLASSGNWHMNLDKDHKVLQAITTLCENHNTNITVLGVDIAWHQNAGANMVQQLAYALAHANEYLNHFQHSMANSGTKAPIAIKVAVGSNYFFEIAKIRALRWLWCSLADRYGIMAHCHILAIPSTRNKTLYDYNVNMLRTTSECMSAILGGADTICNLPYDAIYHKANEFGDRIARNQLLLLKEESYFNEAFKASEGAYYIESLTQQMAQKALALFKQIETGGGFLSQLKKGGIQKKIKESAAKEQHLFDTGQLVLLGTNKFQNDNDRMKHELQLYPFVKTSKRKTLVEPIIPRRLSEKLEQKRLDDE